jgi:hypothetical protein
MNGPARYDDRSFVDHYKEIVMKKLLNRILFAAALAMLAGSAYAEPSVEVYKSPT